MANLTEKLSDRVLLVYEEEFLRMARMEKTSTSVSPDQFHPEAENLKKEFIELFFDNETNPSDEQIQEVLNGIYLNGRPFDFFGQHKWENPDWAMAYAMLKIRQAALYTENKESLDHLNHVVFHHNGNDMFLEPEPSADISKPEPPAEPGRWKAFANRFFGAYADEFKTLNLSRRIYEVQKRAYDAQQLRRDTTGYYEKQDVTQDRVRVNLEELRAQSKQLANQLEDQNPWWHMNSRKYRKFLSCLKKVNTLWTKDSKETELLKAYSDLQKACEDYLADKAEFRATDLGSNRYAIVQKILEMQKREQQALRVKFTHDSGSIQNCLSASRDLNLSEDSITRSLGAKTSSRSEINTGILHGVFTEDKKHASSLEELLHQRLEEDKTLAAGLKGALLRRIEHCEWIEQMRQFKTKEEFTQFFQSHGFCTDETKEPWEQMAEQILSTKEQGTPFYQVVGNAIKDHAEILPKDMEPLQAALKNNRFVGRLMGNAESSENTLRALQEEEKLKDKDFQAMNLFVEACSTDAHSFLLADSADISLDRRTHLNERNIATSIMAELLGCGDVIVRAESASMTRGGEPPTTSHGMYMDFAEGIDGATALGNQPVRQNTALLNNGNLKRQAADLQLLDCLCGQIDRHGNNIIFEQDPQTGAIIGLKGIDNDMAFGTSSVNGRGFHSIPMGMIRTVNQKTVDALDCLSQEVIEYRFQHLLSKEERDALWNRIDTFREWVHTDQVKIVPEQEWEQMSWQDLAEGFEYTPREYDHAKDPATLENVNRLQNMFYRIGAVILPPNTLQRKSLDHIKDRVRQGYEFDSEEVKSKRVSREAAVKVPQVPIARTAAPTANRGMSM